MKLIPITGALVLLTVCASQSLAQSSSIYGAYQFCLFTCTAIRINPDFTFEYRLSGDLWSDKRIKGTWRFIGRNKIRATSPRDSSPPQVSEKITNREDGFLITVFDQPGAFVQGTEISGISNGSVFKVDTNEEGVAVIPKCEQFEVRFVDYRGTHKVQNPNADEFIVRLTNKQMSSMVIDDVWLIEGNRLYKAAENGSFDKRFWYDKLSRKKERNIFR